MVAVAGNTCTSMPRSAIIVGVIEIARGLYYLMRSQPALPSRED